MRHRLLVAYVTCVLLAGPAEWVIFGIYAGRDLGERGGSQLREELSRASPQGRNPSSAEIRQLAQEIAKQVQATTNWYRIAAEISIVQFTLLGVVWAVIAKEWLRVGVVPVTTLAWGNVLIQDPVRNSLAWEQTLVVFVVAQMVVCYAASGLFAAGVTWVSRMVARRA